MPQKIPKRVARATPTHTLMYPKYAKYPKMEVIAISAMVVNSMLFTRKHIIVTIPANRPTARPSYINMYEFLTKMSGLEKSLIVLRSENPVIATYFRKKEIFILIESR